MTALSHSPRGQAGRKQARLLIVTARVAARRWSEPEPAAQHFLRVAHRAWPFYRLRGARTDPGRAFIRIGMQEWRRRLDREESQR